MDIKQRYESLTSEKTTYLQRAREVSRLTIPHVMPQESTQNTARTLPTPFQSIGGRGVSTLSSKVWMTMFPSGTPFFRYEIDQLELHQVNTEIEQLSAQLTALGDSPEVQAITEQLNDRKTFIGDVKKTLSRFEKKVISVIEEHNIKNYILDSLKHDFITGNTCIHINEKFKTKVFSLDNYACDRDREGNIKEIITREKVVASSIEDSKRPEEEDTTKEFWIYTHVIQEDEMWVAREYINDILTSTAKFPLNALPFIVPRFNMMTGENYNYGYVAEFLGDLITLEGLERAIVQAAAAAAKVKWMVKPNSMTKIRQLQNTKNGGFVLGNAGDIEPLQLNKGADLRVAQQEAERLTIQLQQAFLMQLQRKGERVTATEHQLQASEMDTALGGLYSQLAAEIQLPLVNIITFYLRKSGDLPELPNGVKPSIITGADAIGRNADATNLMNYVSTLGQLGMGQYINNEEIANRLAASLLIETDGLIKSNAEVQAEQAAQQQAQMQADMAKAAAAPIANNATKNIGEENNE